MLCLFSYLNLFLKPLMKRFKGIWQPLLLGVWWLMWTCCDQRSVSKLHESNLNWSSRWNDGGSNTSQAVGPMRPYKVFKEILWEWLGVGREQVQIQCIDFFLPNVWLLNKQHDKRTNFRHHRINGEAVVFCLILGFYTMSFYTMPVFHLPPYY